MINMTSNHTNSSHFLLYGHDEDEKWKEWGEKYCYEELTRDHQERYMQFERIMNTFNCTFATLGLIGNILSIMVLCRKEMRKNCFSQLLIGLVTCDSLHIIFGIMEAIRTSWEDLYHDNLLYIFPWFHYPFYRITLVCSIYMMVAVAIERFFAVCFPHNYHNLNAQRNRALYYIVPAIAAAFLVQIPTFFETKFVPSFDHHYNASNETHTWLEVKQYGAGVSPTDLRYDPTYIVVMHWLRTMFDGILPFVTLLFLNGKIFIGLKKVKHKIELHAKANSNTKDANGNRTHDQQSESNRGTSHKTNEITRDDQSMVTPNHARLSPKTQQETIIGRSSPETSVKPSDVGSESVRRSNSVKVGAYDTEHQLTVAERRVSNSLEHPNLIDDSIVKLGLEDSKVIFRKGSNGEEIAPNAKDVNNTLGTKSDTIHEKQLLVVNGTNMNGRGSISTLNGNIDTTRTYLHSSSMLSGGTIHTGVSLENIENGQQDSLLEAPVRQRDSSGSIRAAVARRKQNMTHRSAAQKREANLAVVLVSSVTMFLICHAPRIFAKLYEACQNGFMSEDNPIYKCNELGLLGIPTWFMYITPFVKFLQIFNAAINFPIYYFMGTSFRDTFHNMVHIKKYSSTLNGNRGGNGMR